MKVGSLFAGIGGFDEAFRRAGFDLAWHVEWDEACRGVLARRFHRPRGALSSDDGQRECGCGLPDADGAEPGHDRGLCDKPGGDADRPLVFSDVQDCGAHNLPAIDVLVGGWPCQPVSVAGKRGASSDERDMWPEFARIAGELRPSWVVGENVPGALSAEGGRYFRRVVDDLTQLGYGVVWRTLDAQHFGVPQRRRRVFVVGCLGDLRSAAQVLLEPEGGSGDSQAGREAGKRVAGGSPSGIARPLRTRENLAHREDADTLISVRTTGQGWMTEGNPSLRAHPGGIPENLIAHTLRAEGHDASEDGTGRGTPIVTTMRMREGKPGGGKGPLLSEDSSLTLAQANDQTVFVPISQDALRGEGVAATPSPDAEGNVRLRDPGLGIGADGDPSFTVSATSPPAVGTEMLVRRLTPTECERLQGFPDGWTEGQADSTRYRQLGNAVAVPVVEWIAHRLMACHERTHANEEGER